MISSTNQPGAATGTAKEAAASGVSRLEAVFRSRLFQSAGLYTIINALNAGVPFLVLPVFTRYMTPSDYGIVAMFQVLVLLTMPLIGVNLYSAVARQFVEQHEIDLPSYIGTCVLIFLATAVLVGGAMWLFANSISEAAAYPAKDLWLVFIYASGYFLLQLQLTLLQMSNRVVLYAVFQVTQMLANVGVSFWLVMGKRLGWWGAVAGQGISYGIWGLVALAALQAGGHLRWRFNKDYARHALAYGLPLVPHVIGAWIITMTSRIFIAHFRGLRDAGLYAVGYQVGLVISLLQNAFNQAWVPWLYERLKQADSGLNEGIKRRIVQATYLYNVLILVAVGLVGLLTPLLLKIFVAADYRESGKFVLWIALGFGFNGMYKMVTNYIFYAGKTHLLATVTLVTAALHAAITYYWTQVNGAIGAAQATTLAFFLSFLGTWYIAARVYPMPWGWRQAR